MAKRLGFHTRYVDPESFRDLRRFSGLTRQQDADELAVTVRTIQNRETGGARIPWMAYRMLRILKGYALPGTAWDGWEIHRDKLFAPNGRWYHAHCLEQIDRVDSTADHGAINILDRNYSLHQSAKTA